jgi:predicted ribosomally synthesized peptide with SipW-like signal peptide
MKKIIISLCVIGAVAAIAVGGTIAYFSDTETSKGNTFTAGTIDIAVNGQNPWSQTNHFAFEDMKPSQVEYSNFTVKNVGANPVNLWKKVDVTVKGDEENGVNEPECIAYGGKWVGGNKQNGVLGTDCTEWNVDKVKNDLSQVISYDLSVKLYSSDEATTSVWEQTLYNMDKTISQINGLGTFLGMIPTGWHMDVVESYHMKGEETGNEYQSDKITFDITLTGEQLKGTVVLEDKDSAAAPWIVKSGTTPKVTFTYGVKDSTLKINTLTGTTVVSGTHSLITYPEAFSTPSGAGWPGTGIVLATVTTDGSGNITGFTQVETNPGTFKNMKVWLIPSSDLSGATFTAWNPNNYLFDTGLIDYYDSL